jgi:hypothetical protein
MKRFLSLFAIAAVFALSACAVAPAPNGHAQTPAEVAAAVCPNINTTLLSLGALALEPKAMADIAIATEAVKLVCAPGAVVVDFSSLQNVANSSLPLLLGAVKDAGLEVAKQNELVLQLTGANIILNGAIQSAQAAGLPTK